MPKDLQEQCARCVEGMSCPSPTASPTVSDDESGDGMQDKATEEEVEDEAQWNVMDCVEGILEVATQAGGGNTILACSI